MTDLIKQLEAATEGSRNLDAAIAEVAVWHPGRAEELQEAGHAFYDTAKSMCACYTTSIDAALTLVPEDFSWRLQQTLGKPGGMAALVGPDDQVGDYHIGATPALALCIAILKARDHE